MQNMKKHVIVSDKLPAPIGTYSAGIKVGNTIYLSGQIPQQFGDFKDEVRQIFNNIEVLAKAAGGNLNHIVKLTVFLTDFNLFSDLNQVMTELFTPPYPARSTVQVSRLPKDSRIEIEAILHVEE